MQESDKPRCQHIMDSGNLCATPPIKNEPFCYYHRRLHADFILPGHPAYIPPVLESRAAVQIAIHHVYLAVSKSLLERKLARTMLYALRLAQQNLNVAVNSSCDATTEITPAMQDMLQRQQQHLLDVPEDVPRSTHTAVHCPPVRLGVNSLGPIEADPARALDRSNELHNKHFSLSTVPEFCPELDIEEWRRVTRDLPRKGEPGTAIQQMNARRVLQVLAADAIRRRMAGVK